MAVSHRTRLSVTATISEDSLPTCNTTPVVELRANREARAEGRIESPGTLSDSKANWVYKAWVDNARPEDVGGGTSKRGEVFDDVFIPSRVYT